jgi:hypothetical protein
MLRYVLIGIDGTDDGGGALDVGIDVVAPKTRGGAGSVGAPPSRWGTPPLGALERRNGEARRLVLDQRSESNDHRHQLSTHGDQAAYEPDNRA